jgi:hypothetical protein
MKDYILMALEKFYYKIAYTTVDEDGEEVQRKHSITLPKFDQIPFGLIRKNRSLPQAEQFFVLLEQVVSETDLDIIDKTTQAEMLALVEAWQKDSGISLGESSDS